MPALEIPFVDPVAAFAPWAERDWAMFLDGGDGSAQFGRYSFIAVDPRSTILSMGGDDPFARLRAALPKFDLAAQCPLPFQGGAVGLFPYELGACLERAPVRHAGGRPFLAVGIYDAAVGFDLVDKRAWVCWIDDAAEAKARSIAAAIAAAPALPHAVLSAPIICEPELTRGEYVSRVERVIDYIRAGDIFQANFTQRFLGRRPADFDPFTAYRILRRMNPAPFASYIRISADWILASASPERFLCLGSDGLIQARPIKGTIRRGADAQADKAAARELAASVKDRAENLMITDLLRNDLGRAAEIGSVRVPVLYGVESTATLHHLVSVVEARLRPGLDAVDLLRAAFPGGSITGAPKVRAMEIIDELEPAARGAYCGAVGWIGGDGAMDSSITIRAVGFEGDQVIVQAGGGITADSDPASEYFEMRAKAAPALAALGNTEDSCIG